MRVLPRVFARLQDVRRGPEGVKPEGLVVGALGDEQQAADAGVAAVAGHDGLDINRGQGVGVHHLCRRPSRPRVRDALFRGAHV